jgi:predicted peroxiredoxin
MIDGRKRWKEKGKKSEFYKPAYRLLARVLKEGVQFWYNETPTVKGGGGRENVPLENL